MKKKILSILITILSLCTCIFTLTACDDKEPPHTHEYTTLKYDALSHWYECTCGDKHGTEDHKGGTATETNKATCSVCNQEYGESLGHIHTLHLTKVDATIQSCTQTGNIEYFTCSCGKWFTDNTATTEITDKESVVIAKDDHEYKELKKSATEHWYECICGDKYGIENHKGGTATCQVKATCSVCETVYGNLAEHSPKQDWIKTETHHYHECVYGCTEKLNYDEHNFDNNKKCNDCDYVTTALFGTEISSDIYQINGTNLSLKVPNEQTNFSFANTINVAKGATYKVYTDISCKEIYCIPSYAVNNLTVGNNTYYFLVSNGTEIPQVYTVKIRRRPMYTVTFNTDGGTSVSNQVIEEDSLATEPLTTKTGYDFVSWNYDFNTPITDNITITAEWNIKQYTLTVVYDNGQENLVLRQDYNTQIQTIKTPEKTGYSFAGWDNTMPSTMPAEDLTITAKWTINKYILTIVYENGQEDLILTQDYNTPIQPVSNPVRDGYAFAGWNNVIPTTMPAENLTITAQWLANDNTPYKVEYYLQNLEDDNYTKTQTVDKTGTTDCVVTAEILSFDHFTPTTQLVSEKINGNGQTILKVYYTRNYYQVKVEKLNNKGTVSGAGNYANAQQVQVTASVNQGYNFDGWYNGQTLVSIDENYIFNPVSNIILTAKWSANTDTPYKVEYHFENINDSKYTVDDSLTQCLTGITDTWVSVNVKTFEHFTAESQTVRGLILGDESTVIKVYYKRNLYTLAKENNFAGDVSNTGRYKYGTNITSTATINLGYEFVGWFYGENIISTNEICDLIIQGNIVAKTKMLEEMSIFNFSSTKTTCEINSLNSCVADIIIPACVTSIGSSAFSGKSQLKSVTFMDNSSMTTIGPYAFSGCSGLTNIIIPNNVKNIEYFAFEGCEKLESIFLGKNVEYIHESHVFLNCYSLSDIIVNENNQTYKSIEGNLYSKDEKTLIKYAIGKNEATFEVPNMVAKISKYAFYGCLSLTNVKIPTSVINIDYEAFAQCSFLTILCEATSKPNDWDNDWNNGRPVVWDCNNNYVAEDGYIYKVIDGIGYRLKDGEAEVVECSRYLTIANLQSNIEFNGIDYRLTTILNRSFYICDLLTNVIIPNSVICIDGSAFSHCRSLTSIVIPNNVLYITGALFYDCDSLTIYCESATKPSGWSDDWNDYHHPVVWDCENNDIANDGYIYTIIDGIRYGLKDNYATVVEQPKNIVTANISEEIVYKGETYKVTHVATRAFDCCALLTTISLPNNLLYVGDLAFATCTSLNYNQKGVFRYLGNEDNKYLYLVGVIEGWIQSGEIDKDCKVIGYKAFRDSYIKEINLPSGLKSICFEAFSSCRIENICIPSSVEFIDDAAFLYYQASSIIVEENNLSYKSIDGNLYSKDGKVLIKYATLKEDSTFIVPEGVECIGKYAFYNCLEIKKIVLPESVLQIDDSAFYGASLENIIIDGNINNIGSFAFFGCYQLKRVYIQLSEEEWLAQVTIEYGNYHVTEDMLFYYSETEPNLNIETTAYDGNYWKYDENGEIVVWEYKKES